MNRVDGPHLLLDGRDCVLLARLLAPMVTGMGVNLPPEAEQLFRQIGATADG